MKFFLTALLALMPTLSLAENMTAEDQLDCAVKTLSATCNQVQAILNLRAAKSSNLYDKVELKKKLFYDQPIRQLKGCETGIVYFIEGSICK